MGRRGEEGKGKVGVSVTVRTGRNRDQQNSRGYRNFRHRLTRELNGMTYCNKKALLTALCFLSEGIKSKSEGRPFQRKTRGTLTI